MLAGFLALIAPGGGSSGLPKEAARAVEALIPAPAAVAANTSRLDIIAHYSFGMDGRSATGKVRMTFVGTFPHCGLIKTGIDLAAGVLLFRSWWAKGSRGLVSG